MTLIYCLHGDETVTEQIAKQLNKELEIEIILGNPKAREKEVRFIESDLNRSFNKIETYESDRARELQTILKNKDFIIDLHTTSAVMDPVAIITNDEQLQLVAKTGMKKVVFMNKDFSIGGSLIENIPNSFSIEFHPDEGSCNKVKDYIRSAFNGKQISNEFEIYEVIEIVKGEYDPKIRNLEILPDGTYPIFSGERSYKGISFLRTRKVKQSMNNR